MSEFCVSLRKIDKVWNHPNADRLDLAQVDGCAYQFVVGRDEFKAGDPVVYFPIDSLLPAELIEKLGLTGRLAGSAKNRIKTVRLRQEISQGICARPELAIPADRLGQEMPPEELTTLLGVTKYEPPEVPCHAGRLCRMPDGVPIYDIEGADNHPEVVALLMNTKVCVTEKLEGSNFWATFHEGVLEIGQRKHVIKPVEGKTHDFVRVAYEQNLHGMVQWLGVDIFPGKRVTIRGEYCGPGVQKNIYGLEKNRVYLFDILVDGEYLPPIDFLGYCRSWGAETVPVLDSDVFLRDWLQGKTIRQASNGRSKIALNLNTIREGVVIKPMIEGRHPKVGRLMIKQRDPEYLEKTGF